MTETQQPRKRTPDMRLGQRLELLAVRRKDAAHLLGVSEGTLRNWEAERKGPPFLRASGRAVLYERARLHACMAAHATDPVGGVDVRAPETRRAPNRGAMRDRLLGVYIGMREMRP